MLKVLLVITENNYFMKHFEKKLSWLHCRITKTNYNWRPCFISHDFRYSIYNILKGDDNLIIDINNNYDNIYNIHNYEFFFKFRLAFRWINTSTFYFNISLVDLYFFSNFTHNCINWLSWILASCCVDYRLRSDQLVP